MRREPAISAIHRIRMVMKVGDVYFPQDSYHALGAVLFAAPPISISPEPHTTGRASDFSDTERD